MGKIPAKRAVILWESEHVTGQGDVLSEIHVCEIGKQGRWARRLSNSRGACDFDWLAPGRWDATPMGVFVMITSTDRPASREMQILALREFTKIEGETWAKEMLRDLGEKDHQVD